MGSLDRIGQLQAAKAFLRFCKHNKSSASSTGPPGHEKANQSSSLIGVSDFDKLVAKTNLSRQFILKQVNESENQEQQIANSQIPFSSLAPVLKNDVYLEKRTQFTLPGHDQSSPKFKNVRIIELEGKWKYWIPTKHVKSSDEDIIVRYLNKNGINTPDVIPLPPNAPSSFNREEFLKKCKAVKFGNESLTFHETRKLPKEIKSNISGLTDSKDVRQKIEDHLTPLSAEDALNSKCSEHAEKVLDSDCILLFSDQPEDKKSPHIKFSPGKKCPPGRFSEVGNWISVEMNNLSVPGHQMDFSFYDSDVKFLYEKLEGEQRVLATNLKVYSTICSSWRAYLMSTKLEVVSKVLRLTPEHDKGKICVRWRVKTLSPLRFDQLI